jgi:hypothetical protein
MDWVRILAYVTGRVDQLQPPFQLGLQDAIFRAQIFADYSRTLALLPSGSGMKGERAADDFFDPT